MPSLGFLKKKRAKEDKPDPSSQPTSPVTPITPTSAKTFESNSLTTIPTQSTVATSVGSLSHPTVRGSQETPASAGGGPQMNSAVHQAAPYGLQPTPSPAHTGTPQSLPSINNLINLPQSDGKKYVSPGLILMSNVKSRSSWNTPTATSGANFGGEGDKRKILAWRL